MRERRFRLQLEATAFIAGAAIIIASWALYVHFEQTKNDKAAIVELCGQGAALEDVVMGGIAVVTAELKDPHVPDRTHRADRAFLARFHRDLLAVEYLLTNPHSACQKATP